MYVCELWLLSNTHNIILMTCVFQDGRVFTPSLEIASLQFLSLEEEISRRSLSFINECLYVTVRGYIVRAIANYGIFMVAAILCPGIMRFSVQ